jgi:methyl-accepting chemotaxis protein
MQTSDVVEIVVLVFGSGGIIWTVWSQIAIRRATSRKNQREERKFKREEAATVRRSFEEDIDRLLGEKLEQSKQFAEVLARAEVAEREVQRLKNVIQELEDRMSSYRAEIDELRVTINEMRVNG